MQSAAVWNRTERDLRRVWHTGLRGAFTVLQDDADLYPWLWGRSWSWIWLLVPLTASVLALLGVLALWSHQLQAGLPAAGPWSRLPLLMAMVASGLGLVAGLGAPPRLPEAMPWPITPGKARRIALLGPFLHPASGLAFLLGLASGLPWLAVHPLLGLGGVLLPLAVFRLTLGVSRFLPRLKGRQRSGMTVSKDPEQALRSLFQRLLGRGLPLAGGGLAAYLAWNGDLVPALAILAFTGSLVQSDILRIERRAASLVALWPLAPERKLEARLAAVRRWAAPSATLVLAGLVFKFGAVGALPGILALLESHLTGAALGLTSSAATPLEAWSLWTFQSLGLSVVLAGLLPGWLLSRALASPAFLGAQIVAVGAAWSLLQRAKERVRVDWRAIQEALIEG